jgi:signal transduction histidine kinase
MPKGGIITISLRSLTNGNHIGIQFKDNGIGISKENLDKVFDPLFTTKGVEGSGYGLAICKRIIEDNHRGKIFVKSKFNVSTTIFIKLEKTNV